MDDNLKVFVVEYYELLHNCSPEMKNVYSDNAIMKIYNKNSPPKVVKANFESFIPLGKRKITKYGGEIVDNQMYVHVQSELEQPYNNMIVDESFVCSLTRATIMINYHSIHINPLIEPIEEAKLPKPVQKIEQKEVKKEVKPVKKAVEVKKVDEIKTFKSVLVLNLPFNEKPEEFLPQLETHGKIIKYCVAKGKILAEYENKECMFKAKDSKYQQWKGRQPKVIRCPKEFSF